MKGILIMLLFSFSVAISAGSERYVVYKISGQAERYSGSEWELLERRDSVDLRDRLRISEGSCIGILDNTSGRIYYSDNSGEQSVATVISAARRRSDDITGQVNRQIRQAMTDSGTSGYSYKSLGASHRGESGYGATEAVYAAIACALEISDGIPDNAGVKLRMVPVDESSFCFSIENCTDKTLCVNVLSVSENKRPKVCFNVGYSCDEPYMLISPNSKQTVRQFVFADTSDDRTEYFSIAAEEVYDVQKLQMLLNASETSAPAGNTAAKVLFAHLNK